MSIRTIKGGRAIHDNLLNTPLFFHFRGSDCIAGTWTAKNGGNNLTLVTNAPQYAQSDNPLGAFDTSVFFSTIGVAGRFAAASNTIYDMTSQDTCWMAVVKNTGAAIYRAILSKSLFHTANDQGIWWRIDSGDTVSFRWSNVTTDAGATVTSAAIPLGWNMIHCFIDTNENSTNGMQLYINGMASGSGGNVSTASTVTNTQVFVIGAEGGSLGSFAFPFDSHIATVNCWAKSSWWPGSTNNPIIWGQIAMDHYQRWINGI